MSGFYSLESDGQNMGGFICGPYREADISSSGTTAILCRTLRPR
jgi:hypothetical protein